MAVIVPTITAENAHVFREQIERVEGFARRIHIDVMDGQFTPNKSVDLGQVWWPEQLTTDIHVMFQNPQAHLHTLIELKPQTVILQAESAADLSVVAGELHEAGINFGISLLPTTAVAAIAEHLSYVDQVLLFSGNLGYQGGSHADLGLLSKVDALKDLSFSGEIAWDGGVNEHNVAQLVASGIEVVNVGGFIHAADDPELAYNSLTALLA